MEPHFKIIADAMVNRIPAGWQKAWLTATEVESDTAEWIADYLDHNGVPQELDIDDPAVARAITQIHSIMNESDPDPWTSCVFTLFPSGNFDFEVGFSDQESEA